MTKALLLRKKAIILSKNRGFKEVEKILINFIQSDIFQQFTLSELEEYLSTIQNDDYLLYETIIDHSKSIAQYLPINIIKIIRENYEQNFKKKP